MTNFVTNEVLVDTYTIFKHILVSYNVDYGVGSFLGSNTAEETFANMTAMIDSEVWDSLGI